MMKINQFRRSRVSWRSLLVGTSSLSLCCLVTLGCTSTATEMKVKVCTAERGKPLPPECFPKGSQYGSEVLPLPK
jgi:hypothetical protein